MSAGVSLAQKKKTTSTASIMEDVDIHPVLLIKSLHGNAVLYLLIDKVLTPGLLVCECVFSLLLLGLRKCEL